MRDFFVTTIRKIRKYLSLFFNSMCDENENYIFTAEYLLIAIGSGQPIGKPLYNNAYQ
jgi:hypothetical protein